MENLSLIFFTFLILVIPKFRYYFFHSRDKKLNVGVSKRLPFFDFIKGVAILAVILIHVSYFYIVFSPENNIYFVNLINNLTRFAIPLFFICSGILLSVPNKKQGWSIFYKKKFFRIFIPYLLITVVYGFVNNSSLTNILYNIISGQVILPYYFIIVLLQFYLFYPIIVHFKNEKYFLLISLLISLISQLIPGSWAFWGIYFMGPYFFFFAFGIKSREYFLNFKPDKKQYKFWLLILVVYLIFIFSISQTFFNIRLFYGPAIFYLLFYFKDKIKDSFIYKPIISFGKNSLWIYLLHFQMVYFSFLIIDTIKINFYLGYFLVFIISTILSYLFAWLIQRIYNYFVISKI